MNAFGLDQRERSLLNEVFRHHPEIEEVRIFGSRANGNHEKNSDIDLALWGKINSHLLAGLAGELDELPLPYHFDLSVYGLIRNAALKEHIDRVAKTIYRHQTGAIA